MNGAANNSLSLIDISLPLGEDTPVFPGDPPFERQIQQRIGKDNAFELSSLRLGAHAGTHIDSPSHFMRDGHSLDQAKLESFILPAQVVQSDHDTVQASDLDSVSAQPGRAILFRTRNSLTGLNRKPGYKSAYVYLTLQAAQRCLEMGAPLVGIDYLSVDRDGDPAYPVHRLLLSAGCLILEGLELSRAAPGKYGLFCLPLNIAGAEASPVRAVLVPPDENGRLSLTFGPAFY
jgi:arylformamidase